MEIKEVTTLVLDKIGGLLIEGRLEDVKNKYPYTAWEGIDNLVKIDPSGNNKYLSWLAKIYMPITIKWYKDNPQTHRYNDELNFDSSDVPTDPNDERWGERKFIRYIDNHINSNRVSELKDNLEHFHKNPSKYTNKDINQYDSDSFNKEAEIAKQKLSRKEMKETGIDKVFENDDFILLMPKTHKAACRYGSRTRWCVTMRGHTGYYERYFTEGPIFFLIDKRALAPTNSMNTEDYYKVAMHYKPFNGRLSSGGERGLQFTKSLTKQEFIDGGSLNRASIDYWNVQDENKKENVVLKYLGGPGRGQKERGTNNLTKLKSAMEKYTKQYLSQYYDSVGDLDGLMDKMEELKSVRQDLNDTFYQLDNRNDELYRVKNNLSDYLGNFSIYDGLSDDEKSLYDWGKTQMDKAESFHDANLIKLNEIRTKLDLKDTELNEIKEKLKGKGLFFYDVENSVSMR